MSTSQTLGGRSTVLHADSFAAIAKAETPFSWPVVHFYKEVTSSEARLDAFTSGDVRDIVCYKDGVHEYLLMCVHIQNERVPLVWVRTERHPVKSNIAKMSSQSLAALDTIKFSYDRSKLWNSEDDNMMASAFATLNFRHVIDLLHTVHQVSDTYGITGLNCMWYAGVVMGTLQGGFGKVWVNPPRRDWVRIALNLFGKDTTKATQSVERHFVTKRPMNRFSLMEPEAWQNERFSPKAPAQLPLDDPPQYDSTTSRGPEPDQSEASGSNSATETSSSPPPRYEASTDSRIPGVASGFMPKPFAGGITFVPPNLVAVDPSSEPSWTWDPITNVYRLGHTFIPMPAPFQPSNSKQHDSGGADLNSVGTKEKKGHIASASTSSDEHTREHPPVQSSNANIAASTAAEVRINAGDRRRGPKMSTHPAPGGDRSDALPSKASKRPSEAVEPAPTPHGPRPRSRSRTRNSLSARSNEARPVQPMPSTSVRVVPQTSPREGSRVVDGVSSSPQGAVNAAPLTKAFGQGSHADAHPRSNFSASPSDSIHRTHTADGLAPSIANVDEVPEGALFGSTRQRQQVKPRRSPASSPTLPINVISTSEPTTSAIASTTSRHAHHSSHDVPVVVEKPAPTPKKDASPSFTAFETSVFTFTTPFPSKVAASILVPAQPPPFAPVVQTTRLAHQALSGVVRQDAPRSGYSASAPTARPRPDPLPNTKLTSNLPFPSVPETNRSDMPRKRRVSRKRRNSISTTTSSSESTVNRTTGRSRSQPQTPAGSRPGTPTARRRGGGRPNTSKSRSARAKNVVPEMPISMGARQE